MFCYLESFYRCVSHDPPVHVLGRVGLLVLDDFRGGLAAVTLHRCHRMTDPCRVLTYLAGRCSTFSPLDGDKMVSAFLLQEVMALIRFSEL